MRFRCILVRRPAFPRDLRFGGGLVPSCNRYRGDLGILSVLHFRGGRGRILTTEVYFNDLRETCENTKIF